MPAVSHSSPLIFYAAIGRLELLHGAFGEIFIPPAVWREVVEAGAGRAGASEIAQEMWILQRSPPSAVKSLPSLSVLDAGEAEAISLAMSFDPTIPIILDDLQARRAAEAFGLAVTGAGGVLVRAKRMGLIHSVEDLLTELRSAGLYLGESAVARLLQLAGER